MNSFSTLSSDSETDNHPEQVVAQARYFRLRDKLVALQSALEPNLPAIDAVILELEEAQFAYKATHGLFGNNPIYEQTR